LTLYLDTSALVKLYIDEEHNDLVARAVNASDRIAVSVVAYPEARSAFARQLREGELTLDGHNRIVEALDKSWSGFHCVRVTDRLARTAGQLAALLALRGFDAIHLAAAIRVNETVDGNCKFLAFDERLMQAARQVMPIYDIE
jgi:uncharacterized protein